MRFQERNNVFWLLLGYTTRDTKSLGLFGPPMILLLGSLVGWLGLCFYNLGINITFLQDVSGKFQVMEPTTAPGILIDVLKHVTAAVICVKALRWESKEEHFEMGWRPETGSVCCAHTNRTQISRKGRAGQVGVSESLPEALAGMSVSRSSF